ncbi:flavodoxin [Paenibacillus sp. OAS669]|uniref:flavodoxin n=1 Tax=Paenibacillus sp. OAS669 TaxID=2663821 RepID=UPI00178AE987|nr:flavodoxin [Paenibacillus sp. OAS669]MBE1443210.1 flavodoxin I [Paenibacillus sp. OAS669]
MSKIVMIFASMTGNTEAIADEIAEGIREAGGDVTQKYVMDSSGSELLQYDGILLGAYTWGDGELPDEFLDFYEELDELDLCGKKAAVFGSCDSSYAEYGAAVDTLTAKLQELGAEIALDGLKIELSPSQAEKELCRQYGVRFVEKLKE